MDRVRPFDPNVGEPEYGSLADWTNGNPVIGDEGGIPPFQAWTHVMEEVVNAIEQSGQTPDHTNLGQLWQAILASAGSYVSIAQALSYNRVHPHVMTADNKLTVIDNEDGTVTLAGDQTWVHRGFFPRSSNDLDVEDRTVAIPPNSVGHFRWRWIGGSPLLLFGDLDDDGDYNPNELVDGDPAFDTSFDDILIARIEREGTGTPLIKPLRNRTVLRASGVVQVSHQWVDNFTDNAPPNSVGNGEPIVLDWARHPEPLMAGATDLDVSDDTGSDNEMHVGVRSISRYEMFAYYEVKNPRGGSNKVAWIQWGARA